MKFEVRKFNIKIRSTILKLSIACYFAVIGSLLLISIPNQKSDMIIPVIISGIIMILIFPLVLTYTLTSKIIFDTNKVTEVSFFGKKEINLSDLKTFGVMVQSKYYTRLVNSEELNEKEMFDFNMIFLSTSSTFDFNKLRRPRHIRLEYRADVYNKIKEWKKACAQQGAVSIED